MPFSSSRGVELDVLDSSDRRKTMCLGPGCQCESILQHRQKLHDDSMRKGGKGGKGKGQRKGGKGGGLSPSWVAAACPRLGRDVRVPKWVAYSSIRVQGCPCQCKPGQSGCQSYCEGLLSTPPRFLTRPQNPMPPPGTDLRSMFRGTLRTCSCPSPIHQVSRCQILHRHYVLHDGIDSALVAAGDLITKMHAEFSAVLHEVGMNASMGALIEAAAVCWDWSTLAFSKPEAAHIRALQKVNRLLQACMRNTYYPVAADFRVVPHAWPNMEDLGGQYLVLTRRVRSAVAAGAKAAGRLLVTGNDRVIQVPTEVATAARDWIETIDYAISPMWVSTKVLTLIRAACGLSISSLLCKSISASISRFLGELPAEANDVYTAAPRSLCPVGGRLRVRRSKKQPKLDTVVEWFVGDVVVWYRHLVTIVRVQRRVAVEQVTAALTQYRWFCLGNGDARMQAWHVTRLAHRCSLIFPPEAPCERIGSLLRLRWNPRRNLGPVDMSDLVLLSQANVSCAGSARDELIIDEVVSLLQTTSKYKRGVSSLMPFRILEQEEALEASGRFAGQVESHRMDMDCADSLQGVGYQGRRDFLRKRQRDGQPASLPASLSRALQKGHTYPGSNVLKPLAVDVRMLHAQQKQAAGSVLTEKTTSWLESEDGKQWSKERDALFSGADQEVTT